MKTTYGKAKKGSVPQGIQTMVPSDPRDEDIPSPNPLKRSLFDGAIDYPRRRATIACEVCRSRKSRCDGNKPKCKLCTELGANCVYREPGVKLDAGDKLILEQLSRIEGMLQVGFTNGGNFTMPQQPHSTSDGSSNGPEMMLMLGQPNFAPTSANGVLGGWPNNILAGTNISTMPKNHTSATLHLLRWPIIRDLVSRPYDPQFLLQMEMERDPLQSLAKTPCVDLSNTQAYIEAYFSKVNAWYACVNPYSWKNQYRMALSNGFREGPESCIVLLVLALGQASLNGSISRLDLEDDPPGLQYFMAAWSLLPGMMTTNTAVAAQCHLLAAAYMFYLVRPMEAWNLLCSASMKLQLLLMAPNRIPPQQRELVERIYWNTLNFESDILAELDLPHSGAVNFEEKVGLPGGFEGNDHDQVGSDNLWYFLAAIALRRLLNRVSQLLYSTDSAVMTTSSLEPIVTELDYQLTQWYESLPLPLQFPFSHQIFDDPLQSVLRLRFYACRAVIYRPYVESVLENEQIVMDPVVRECCHKCLEASVRQLEHVSEHQAGHLPYLWQGALSQLSQTLLIMGASLCPPLQRVLLTIIPTLKTLDDIIQGVIAELERYAHLAPSLNLAAEIVRDAETRRQALLGG